jgi:hypothetical protein
VVLALHRSPSAPILLDGIDQPRPLSPYIANVRFNCFKYFRGMLQSFHMNVAKADQGMLHMLHMLQVFKRHVASVCSNCFIWFQTYVVSILIWMLHMFLHICSNNMFQNVLSVSVFCCNKCFHIASCKCSIWMLHMFAHICCKYMF